MSQVWWCIRWHRSKGRSGGRQAAVLRAGRFETLAVSKHEHRWHRLKFPIQSDVDVAVWKPLTPLAVTSEPRLMISAMRLVHSCG